MIFNIMAEKWTCTKCGKYYYINEGAGELMGTLCPFGCNVERGGIGKKISKVKIIGEWKK
jgi:hypothetical protein